MAPTNAQNRKSYFLSVTPINMSLTDGTNIPPPADSPRRSPSLAEPPTPGGGPLSSHPTTPPFEQQNPTSSVTSDHAESFRTPTSPASAAQKSPNAQRPKGVRKLLSLTNLRSSFSSSRTSLSQPRASNDTHPSYTTQAPTSNSLKRPPSPGGASSLAPSTIVTVSGGQQPQLRQKKSGNWFKRKSSLFLLNGDLDTVEESAGARPDTRESKRLKESKTTSAHSKTNPAPFLPDIGALGGGGITGGDLGWDEKVFRRDVVT